MCPLQVSYKTQNFLDKNRDFVVAEHQALMQASSQPFTHLLFPADPDAVRCVPPGLCGASPRAHAACFVASTAAGRLV